MDSGPHNSIPTVFCQLLELVEPQVSTFQELALGYNKTPQQANSIQRVSKEYCILEHAL